MASLSLPSLPLLPFPPYLTQVLQLLVLQPKISKEDQEGASLLTLIRDPYILVAAGALTFANAGTVPTMPRYRRKKDLLADSSRQFNSGFNLTLFRIKASPSWNLPSPSG